MSPRSWGVLVVLCGAIFLEGIDMAMLNVALPAIRADLGLSTAVLSGVVSAYVLGYGGFMLLGGRAADLLGRRRMFLLWLVVFLVFSGLGGLADEGWVLLVARFATGVAAAFLAPAGLSLITTTFPEGPLRTRALGFYAGAGAGGFSLGLVAGGLLTPLGWRWVFFAPVIMCTLILAAAIPLLPRTPAPGRRAGGFDLAGAASVTAAMLLLVYAVVRLERGTQGLPVTLAALAAGLVALAVFVVVERRAAAPLVRLGILRSRALVRADTAALLYMGAFGGFQFLVTLYLQEVRGWTPLQTGLVMIVAAIDTVLAPTVTPRLVERFGTVRVLLAGVSAAVLAYGLFLRVDADWTYGQMFPSILLLGVAFTLAYGPFIMAATDGVAEEEQGLASGLLYTGIQFGTALGLAAVTAVQAASGGGELQAIRAALWVPVVAAALAALVVATGLGRRRAAVATPSPAGTYLTAALD